MSITRATLLAAVVCAVLAAPSSALADPVVQTVGVSVKAGQMAAYLQAIKDFAAVQERLGIKATIRVFQTTLAGPDTGTTVVAIEYPNFAALADAQEKQAGDSDAQAFFEKIGGMRTVVSSSLLNEITP